MNKENLDLLKNILHGLGFGDDPIFIKQLEESLLQDSQNFELYTEAYFDDNTKLNARLYFHRSDHPHRFLFTKYDCLLRYSTDPSKDRAQTVYIKNDEGITVKEAFNLLQGRSVNKNFQSIPEGQYNAWVQLNFDKKDQCNNYKFRQYRTEYGYDLEKVLSKYPIEELTDEETKAVLLRSLKRGNIQLVTFVKINKTEKMFIEANPMFKTINIFPMRDPRHRSKASPKK
jgi:hypothetical protein